MTQHQTSPGRRRADFPAAGTTVAATAPRDPWDEPQPARASAIPAALDAASDSLNRLEGILVNLDGLVDILAEKLQPVLTTGNPAPMPPDDERGVDPSPDDHRSTIAQSIARLDRTAYLHGDYADRIIRRLSAIIEHIEA